MNDQAQRDVGPAERHQHGRVEAVQISQDGGRRTVQVARDKHATMIDALYEKGLLVDRADRDSKDADRRYDAAQMFQDLFARSGYARSVTASYGAQSAVGTGEMSDGRAYAQRDFGRCMDVLGRLRWRLYDLLVMDSLTAEVDVIRRGLDKLVRHWGM